MSECGWQVYASHVGNEIDRSETMPQVEAGMGATANCDCSRFLHIGRTHGVACFGVAVMLQRGLAASDTRYSIIHFCGWNASASIHKPVREKQPGGTCNKPGNHLM